MPTAARSRERRPHAAALDAIESAGSSRERAEALVRLTSEIASDDPDLVRFRFSLLAMMRAALAGGEVAAGLAGEPRMLVEGIELPAYSAADIANEAALRGLARAGVLDEEMLTASAVSALLGSRSKNPRQYANRLRLRGEIVGVPHQNQYLYPAFQFDEERRRVWPAAFAANRILGAADDPWGVASWWVTPDGWLGRPPKDVLGSRDDEAVLTEAARDTAEGY
ncbi:MAG: hypothetical protein IBX62_03110 [Coriobacteriia bacterium]|nr:hypothetical protein [Coriobacteriia bacterium]